MSVDKEVRIRVTRQRTDGAFVDMSFIISDQTLNSAADLELYLGHKLKKAIKAVNKAVEEE